MSTPRLVIHEVGLRDGLQMEHETVPTATKLRWLKALAATGVDIIQAGSFVHPTRVPQMADTDALFRDLMAPGGLPSGVVLSGLVLNEKGLERGLACGVRMFCMGVSASETHSQKNTGMSVAEATTRIIATAQQAIAAQCAVQVSVQSAFGCGFEGAVPEDRVLGIVRRYLDAGLTNISLADTAGHAAPDAVERLFAAVRAMDARAELTCHFHNTYGMAVANCIAALRAGVTAFESSVAGLGGCPFTKVAGGNVCTEDLVHMFQRMGERTDIQLDGIIAVAREVAEYFHRDMPGMIYKTGPIRSTQG
ncbi:MAG: hydroxymethylglutaryl-CoA lyase [Ignavibacteriae bacterium]|nr:hydroxymethylglutaryl-CoA lyase [Ignavibacteriota bacterium]